jgi:hypothetical protein
VCKRPDHGKSSRSRSWVRFRSYPGERQTYVLWFNFILSMPKELLSARLPLRPANTGKSILNVCFVMCFLSYSGNWFCHAACVHTVGWCWHHLYTWGCPTICCEHLASTHWGLSKRCQVFVISFSLGLCHSSCDFCRLIWFPIIRKPTSPESNNGMKQQKMTSNDRNVAKPDSTVARK